MSMYRVLPESNPLPERGFYLLMRENEIVMKSVNERFLMDLAETLNALRAFREAFQHELSKNLR